MSGVNNNTISNISFTSYTDQIQKRRNAGSLTSIILSSPETHKHRRLGASLIREASESYAPVFRDFISKSKLTKIEDKVRREDKRFNDLFQKTEKEKEFTSEKSAAKMQDFLGKFGDLESEEKAADMEVYFANFGDLESKEL